MNDPEQEKINDGGPAYPSEQGHCPNGTWNQTYDSGMSLRDYFAGQALIAHGSHPANERVERVAEWCYKQADAMLKARRN